MNKLRTLLPQLAVYAQDRTIRIDEPGDEFSTLTGLTIPSIVSGLVRLAMVIVALVFFAMLIMGGIRWITSRGDKTEVENARNQITHALIGLAIVFVAWAILALIRSLFGVDLFQLEIPQFY